MLFSLVLLSVLPALGIILYNGPDTVVTTPFCMPGELVRIVTALAGHNCTLPT